MATQEQVADQGEINASGASADTAIAPAIKQTTTATPGTDPRPSISAGTTGTAGSPCTADKPIEMMGCITPADPIMPGGIEPIPASLALDDMEILCNIIEGALFMRGKMISETELSEGLGIPRQPIHEALLVLKKNYEHFKGALQVRNVFEDYWVLELKEVFTRDVDEFYIEDEAYSRSEVMTLAFIAYSQPIPKRVLRFYRGNAATTHARKWLRAGFLESRSLTRGDPVLFNLLDKHARDKEARQAEMEARIESEIEKLKEENDAESIQVDARDLARKKSKRKKPKPKPTDRLECFITTPKFSGYFNLPEDISAMKCELEEWRSICDMLD